MKTRVGFVSNSSSSSFVVVGKLMQADEMSNPKIMEKVHGKDFLNKKAKESSFKCSWSKLNENQKEEIALDLRYESDKIMIFDSEEDGIPEGEKVVGRLISDSEGLNVSNIKDLNKICKELESYGFEGPFQLISGTRRC